MTTRPMTTDELQRLAREAGVWAEPMERLTTSMVFNGRLAIFAAAVRAQALEDAAKIAEAPVSGEQDDITMEAKDRVAAAIRALKDKP